MKNRKGIKMKIVIISNYFNHHQLTLSLELMRDGNNDLIFYETLEIPKERLKLGYMQLSDKYNFVKQTYKTNEAKIIQDIYEADIFIVGGTKIPKKYFKKRIKEKKVIFRYSERVFKTDNNKLRFIDYLKGIYYHFRLRKESNSNSYLLASSSYAKKDYYKMKLYKNKVLKWGYFPVVNDDELKVSTKKFNQINMIWVGRMINWKNPDYPIYILKGLLQKGYDVNLKMIGNGPLYENIVKLSKDLDVYNKTNFIKRVNSNEIGDYYEKANIFLFTSNYKEGWGAVLNEAMSYGCVPFASKAAGSTYYLVNEKNGYILNLEVEEYIDKIVEFINLSEKDKKEKSMNAYDTINKDWNARMAAIRLIKFYHSNKKFNNNILS